MDTLNYLHLCMDIRSMFRNIRECNQSTNEENLLQSQLLQDTPQQTFNTFPSDLQLKCTLQRQLKDITLNFQSLSSKQGDEFLQEEILLNDNNFLQTFISKLKGLTTLRLYFAQSLLNIATYQTICKVVEEQVEYNQIQNLTLCISQSRVQFDLLPLMQIIQRLSNLKKLELKLNFTTKVQMSKGEERLRFPQIEDVNLSLMQCPCSNAILQQLWFENLIKLQVNFSNILISEHQTENMKLLTIWIVENTKLEDIRINIGQAAVIENYICNDVIQAITDKAHLLKHLELNGFNSVLMNERTIGMFNYVAKCETNFINCFRINKNKNSLEINQQSLQHLDTDLEIYRKVIQIIKGSTHEFQFNTPLKFENHNFSPQEKIQAIFDLAKPFYSLSKINLTIRDKILFTQQIFDYIIDYIKISDHLTSFKLLTIGSNYNLDKYQMQEICNLLSEKMNLYEFFLNYNTSKLDQIIKLRKFQFSRVNQSIRFIKQVEINKLFRKEIVNEIIEFAYVRRMQD